jgi:hypothetical protein
MVKKDQLLKDRIPVTFNLVNYKNSGIIARLPDYSWYNIPKP